MEGVYPPGKIILFSEGRYSDYGYCGNVVTIAELNIKQAIDDYKAQYKPKDKWDTPEPSSFVAWLCATQKCVEIDAREIHLGSYGDLRDDPR